MAQVNRLSSLNLQRLKAGMHADGGGLYLQVTGNGARSWIFRFTLGGLAREMGLGSLQTLTLAEARKKAVDCRRLKEDGVDPIEARRSASEEGRIEAAKAITFAAAARQYIESHRAGWKNAKHGAQWLATLEAYAFPEFGDLLIGSIDTGLVLKAIEPIWTTKTETASRVRGRIESILDWATVRGYRAGDNPARWRGHLAKLLPERRKVRKVEHHAALPYVDLPEFLASLRGQEGLAARALELTILTAARSGEVFGARWDEVDLEQGVWTIPAERMKAKREHKVPLGRRALEILAPRKAVENGPFVFPGLRPGKPLSNMAMTAVLRRMERGDLTVHGFRSTFRDWAAERSSFPSEVVEMSLAHAVGNRVEAAYRRGDLFEKRRRLMEAWAGFCEMSVGGKVVQIGRR